MQHNVWYKRLSPFQEYSACMEREQYPFVCMCLRHVDLQCIWLTWIICVRQLYAELYVSASARLFARVISLRATIWPESETLRYHTVGPARCQGVRVPRWLGCLAKTFARLASDATLKAILHFDIKAFISCYAHLDITKWTVDLWHLQDVRVCSHVTFSFKVIYSNTQNCI